MGDHTAFVDALRERVRRLEAELSTAREELRVTLAKPVSQELAGIEELARDAEDMRRSTDSAVSTDGSASIVLKMSVDASTRVDLGDVDRDSPLRDKVALFRARFAGRDDVYAQAWQSARTGKRGWGPATHGYVSARDATQRDFLPLTDAVIDEHLRATEPGRKPLHVGLYPMLPGDLCRLIACDFDGGSWREDARAYVNAARDRGVDALAEISRSGEGAHVWIFFTESVPAARARALGTAILAEAMRQTPSLALESYDRLFPSQDSLPTQSTGAARLGNLIALPLEGDCRRTHATTVFVDPDSWLPFEDQFAALARTRPIGPEVFDSLPVGAERITAGPAPTLDRRPRREDLRRLAAQHVGRTITLGRDSSLHVPVADLPASIITALKHLAAIPNPEFYRRQAQRFSTYNTPRLILCFEHDEKELRVPRGLQDEVETVLEMAGFTVAVESDTRECAPLGLTFGGELRPEQTEAVDTIVAHDTGILVAPPGSGKTVMGCALVARRQVPTAILVPSAELLSQWRERLTRFLDIDDRRIGQLGGGRRNRKGAVDLIMMQSVAHRDADSSILEEYGQIIIDECHHLGAPALDAALRRVDVRQWVGLTATPYRADELDELMVMQCGPIRHTMELRPVGDRRLVLHESAFVTEIDGADGESVQAVFGEVAADADRNDLVTSIVADAVGGGARCLVLTNRRSHVLALESLIRSRVPARVFALVGEMSPSERRSTRGDVEAFDGPCVLIATGQLAGEGVDLPSFDTLCIAAPISYRGKVVQQLGRVTRGGSATATVHDIRDPMVPLLERMYRRRSKAMREAGFLEHTLDVRE